MTKRLAFDHFCSAVRRRGVLALCLVVCTLGLVLSGSAREPTFITFDAPGAGTSSGQGTFPSMISPAGLIAGWYVDRSNVYHGFLRARDGSITTIDAPGAGTGEYQGTYAISMNPAGAISGLYVDASIVFHGFLRAPDGAIATFDVPGAGTGGYQGTVASNINPAGVIAGHYVDAGYLAHGYVRAQTINKGPRPARQGRYSKAEFHSHAEHLCQSRMSFAFSCVLPDER
jgi:hypothetical protein